MSQQQFDNSTGSQSSTKDVAVDEAKNLKANAQASGQQVAGTAKDEARQLAGEAKGQAQDLFHQVRSEATSQVSSQQQRIAGSLGSLSGELDQMARNSEGTASNLVSQAAGQVGQFAGWLENREPADLLGEVRRYARRNPGTFLAGAALVGLIGGRLTRGLQADAHRDQGRDYGHTYGRQGYADTGHYGYAQQGGYSEPYAGGTYGTPVTGAYGQNDPYARPGTETPGHRQDFLTDGQRTAEARNDLQPGYDQQPGTGDLYR